MDLLKLIKRPHLHCPNTSKRKNLDNLDPLEPFIDLALPVMIFSIGYFLTN